jgi:nicotinamidase-related amidase
MDRPRIIDMNRALLVIDVQESFRQRPTWQAMANPDIAIQVARLVDAARTNGDLVVWILHTEPGTGSVFDPAVGHVRLLPGLTARDGEPQLAKTSINAFTTTNLHQQLTQHNIREVVVCGIRTEQCCETTARIAADLGYDVTFVTDATTTSPVPHPDAPADQSVAQLLADPRTLSAADVIARTELVLAGRGFASLATTDELANGVAALAR